MQGRVAAGLARQLSAVALLASALLAGSAATAAAFQVSPAGGATFPQRSLLLSGQGIPALSAGMVHVIENGVPVHGLTIRSLKSPSGNDSGLVLVIDVSAAAVAIEHALTAAVDVANQRPAQQEFGLVEADASPTVALGMTRDPAAIQRALGTPPTVTHHGDTLTQAALTGVQLLAGAHIGAGSLIIVSDGADQGTPATLAQLISAANAAHVTIYGVGIRSSRFNPRALSHIARLGGGQLYEAAPTQVRSAVDAVEHSVESEYLLRYSSVQGPGKTIPASIHIDGVPGSSDITYTSPVLTKATFNHAPKPSSFWTSTLAVLLVALAASLLLLLGAGSFFVRRRAAVHERVGAFLPDPTPAPALGMLDPRVETNSMFARSQAVLEGADWWASFRERVEIAQLRQSPIEIVFLTLALSAIAGVLLYLITGSVIPGILAMIAGPVIARVVVSHRLQRMQRLFAEQLSETLQEVAAAMRAGRSLVDALALVTESASQPTKREFELALADERLGMPLDQALEPIERRMADGDMTQVVLVATLDRSTGASTAEVLDRISEGVRENDELRRELRSLTAQVNLSRWVLTAIPFLILILISVADPSYERPLYHTTFGIVLLVLSAIMIIAGSLVMRQMAKVDY